MLINLDLFSYKNSNKLLYYAIINYRKQYQELQADLFIITFFLLTELYFFKLNK